VIDPTFGVEEKRILPFGLAMHVPIQGRMNCIFNPMNQELLII
jgi:hypothetical protein